MKFGQKKLNLKKIISNKDKKGYKMGILNALMMILFIGFIVILVVGFNRQMMARNKEREAKNIKFKEKKDE